MGTKHQNTCFRSQNGISIRHLKNRTHCQSKLWWFGCDIKTDNKSLVKSHKRYLKFNINTARGERSVFKFTRIVYVIPINKSHFEYHVRRRWQSRTSFIDEMRKSTSSMSSLKTCWKWMNFVGGHMVGLWELCRKFIKFTYLPSSAGN